jgi:arylsulfatase A-like enzyme
MDWTTGALLETLEERGLREHTLVIFTSDNGPVLDDGYADEAVRRIGHHHPSGPYRGGKYSIYEAGTRVPFAVNWPGVIEPGVSGALVSQVDLLASLAELTGTTIEASAGPDSEELLDTFLGRSTEGRDRLLEESVGTLALREGPWKYIRPAEPRTWISERKGIEGGHQPEPQLYDLRVDPGEQTNLAERYPERLEEMQETLAEIVGSAKPPE